MNVLFINYGKQVTWLIEDSTEDFIEKSIIKIPKILTYCCKISKK